MGVAGRTILLESIRKPLWFIINNEVRNEIFIYNIILANVRLFDFQ